MFAYYDPDADIAWFPTGESDDVLSERVPGGLRDYDRTTHRQVAIEVWDASTRLPASILEALPAPGHEAEPRDRLDFLKRAALRGALSAIMDSMTEKVYVELSDGRKGAREATDEEFAAFEAEHGPFLSPDGEG